LKKTLFILSLIISSVTIAQPSWQWANAINSSQDEKTLDVATVLATGETYECGYFDGDLSLIFTLGLNGTPNMSSPNGSRDGFVAKYDALGNVIWGFKIGGAGATVEIEAITDGPNGNIYITGEFFNGTADFQGVTSSISGIRNPTGATKNMFLAAYNSNGELLWVTSSSDTGNSIGSGIIADINGIYVAGQFEGDITFPPLGVVTWSGAASYSDGYVAKFDYLGNAIRVKTIFNNTGDGHLKAFNVATDGTDVYVVGTSGSSSWTYGPTGVNPTDNNNGLLGTEDVWVISIRENTFNLNWAQVIGSVENDIAKGITVDAVGIYLTGGLGGPLINFPGIVPVASVGIAQDIFSAKLFSATGLTDWVFMEQNNSLLDAYGNDIVFDPLGNLYITGAFVGNTDFNAGGDIKVSLGGTDVFVMSRNLAGTYMWTETAGSTGNDEGFGIGIDNVGGIYTGGSYDLTSAFGSISLATDGQNNGFVAKLNLCSLSIICPVNQTVTANSSCQYTLLDYTAMSTPFASCGIASVNQMPIAGTIVNSGVNPVTVYLTDNSGNIDSCSFDVIVQSAVNPTVVSCGTWLQNETTVGSIDTENNFGCVGFSTPGEDVYYQITVPAGNFWLQINLDSVSDANDAWIETFWVGGSCPLGGGCIASDFYDIATQQFSTGGNTVQYLAVGPGTYYFVVDAQVDGIDSYNIGFNCLDGGIEFDTSLTCGDPNNDGIIPYVNNSTVLTTQTCQSVNICHDMYIANQQNAEWIDSVYMDLGSCYTNVVPTTVQGFYQPGSWVGNYNGPINSISWEFNNTSTPAWGDGSGGSYSCDLGQTRLHRLCFTADIRGTCVADSNLNISLLISDDAIGSSGSTVASFDYVLSDDFIITNPLPTITCPLSSSVNNDAGNCSAQVIGIGPTASGDNCPNPFITYTLSGATLGSGANDASGNNFNVGVTTVQYLITDSAGNIANCNFTVTVVDNEVPTFSCPANINEFVDSNCDFLIPDYTGLIVGLNDNCTVNTSIVVSQSPVIGTTISGNGTTQNITLYATDIAGNIDSCKFVITLNDTIKPVINCPINISQNTGINCSFTLPNYSPISVTDNCTAAAAILLTQSPIAGTIIFSDTLVMLTADDGNGNTDTCSFMVFLNDSIFPTITCPNDTILNNDLGLCDATISFGIPINSDNCGIASLLNDFTGTGNASGTYLAGLTTVTWTIKDLDSNTTVCSFDVTVIDAEEPTITCINDTIINTDVNSCDAVFNYVITAFDNCFYTISQIAGLPSGANFPQGITTNIFFATDSLGLADTCSFLVTVVDNQAPTIICPNDTVLCNTSVTIPLPNLGDNCTVGNVVNDFNLTGNASGIYPAGVTSINWTVSDANGNSNSCVMTVQVDLNPSIAYAGEDQNVVLNQSTNFEANVPTIGVGTWTLIFGNGTIDDDLNPSSLVSDLAFGDNIFKWTIVNGTCPSSFDEVNIIVGGLLVPNGFSPNGDNNNDLFVIPGIEKINNEVIIFNRWGIELYHTDNYQNNWNGISNDGSTLPDDTYFYIIKLNDFSEEYSGFVVIKR
jgi:gliding motility-associated-like protein